MTFPAAQIALPDLSGLATASDAAVMEQLSDLASARRRLDAAAAFVAGEIARRSRQELGYSGLAQRTGSRTAEKLVQLLCRSTWAEARALVRVGTELEGRSSWLTSVATAVQGGSLSVGAAEALRVGLGAPTAEITAEKLKGAAGELLLLVGESAPEDVAVAARRMRDALDEDGVADRERLLRDKRYLRLVRLPDGMTRITGLLDPESAALVVDAVDRVTAPRRGGPRFVDPASRKRAQDIIDDERSTDQIAIDALVDMVRIAGSADSGTLFGGRVPSVRVHVTAADLDRRAGSGSIEGQTAAVSIETVERIGCSSGFVPILFENGQSMDVGSHQRLFTARQRVALAARDGGCRFPGCDRPPSWCEAHHVVPWSEEKRTEVADGILLCRHHHMLVHDNGWRVLRRGNEYWLRPPRTEDPDQILRAMPSKSMTHAA